MQPVECQLRKQSKNNLKVAVGAMSWPTELCCACTLQTHCSPLNLSHLHELKGPLHVRLQTGMLRFPVGRCWQMRSRQIHFVLPRASHESFQCPENGVSQVFSGRLIAFSLTFELLQDVCIWKFFYKQKSCFRLLKGAALMNHFKYPSLKRPVLLLLF